MNMQIDLINITGHIYKYTIRTSCQSTFMPSHLETALRGLKALRVLSALKAPMFPYPALSAPKLKSDI